MPKKHKIKLSKKQIAEKYPTKFDVGEDIAQFTKKLVLTLGFVAFVAIGVDLYHLTH